MENKELARLAEQLNLTSLEPEQEEYILTKDEEDYVVANALLSSKRHMTWKLKGLAFTDDQIKDKISTRNWDEEINLEAILLRANSNKHYDIWQKSQREKEKKDEVARKEELIKTWTAKNIFSLMKWTSENVYEKTLIVNESNKKFITAICFFLSRDIRFETELGFSLKKGLMIRGISGLGKTFTVACVEKNELNPIQILSMIEIADKIKSEGEYEIRMGENKIIYLDDVGTEEPTINHYGTKINYFKNFIETVYLRSKIFNHIIISTNNTFSEIEEKYGFRVRSRMKDMFNIVDVTGIDMRG